MMMIAPEHAGRKGELSERARHPPPISLEQLLIPNYTPLKAILT